MQSQEDLEKKLAQIQALLDQVKLDLSQTPKPVGNQVVNTPNPINPPKSVLTDTLDSVKDQISISNEPQNEQTQSDKDNSRPEETDDAGPPIGQVGVFDGEFVFMSNDKKYQVPPNYASKSQLVAGDKLELVSCGNLNEFKLSQQVERIELEGILTKKNFQWTVLIDNVEFLLIAAAVRFFNGDIGDKAIVLLPQNYIETKPKWAALKSIIKQNIGDGGFAGSRSANEIEQDKKQKYLPANMKERKKDEIRSIPIQLTKSVKEPVRMTPPTTTPEPKSIPDKKDLPITEVNKTGEIELEITPEMANLIVETPKSPIPVNKPLANNHVSEDSSVPPLR